MSIIFNCKSTKIISIDSLRMKKTAEYTLILSVFTDNCIEIEGNIVTLQAN